MNEHASRLRAPVGLRAVDDPAADRFLYQSMREPWASEFYKA